jgi:hypothetical protein
MLAITFVTYFPRTFYQVENVFDKPVPESISQLPNLGDLIYNTDLISWDFGSQPSQTEIDARSDVAIYGTNYLPDSHYHSSWVYQPNGLVNDTVTESINDEDSYSVRFYGDTTTKFSTNVSNVPNNLSFAVGLSVLNKEATFYVVFGITNGTHDLEIEFDYDPVTKNLTTGVNSNLTCQYYYHTKKFTPYEWDYYIFNVSSLWEQYHFSDLSGNITAWFDIQNQQAMKVVDVLLDYWYLGSFVSHSDVLYGFDGSMSVDMDAIAGRTTFFNFSYALNSQWFEFATDAWFNLTIGGGSVDPIYLDVCVSFSAYHREVYRYNITETTSIDLTDSFPKDDCDSFSIVWFDLWANCSDDTTYIVIDLFSINVKWVYKEATLSQVLYTDIAYNYFGGFDIRYTYDISYSTDELKTWYIVFDINSDWLTSFDIPGADRVFVPEEISNITIFKYNLNDLPNETSQMVFIEFRDLLVDGVDRAYYTGTIPSYSGGSSCRIYRVNVTRLLVHPETLNGRLHFNSGLQVFTGFYENYGVYQDSGFSVPCGWLEYNVTDTGSVLIYEMDFTNITERIFYIYAYSGAPLVDFITPVQGDTISSDSMDIEIRIQEDGEIGSLVVKVANSLDALQSSGNINGYYSEATMIWSATVDIGSFFDGELVVYIRVEDTHPYSVEKYVRITLNRGMTNRIFGSIFLIAVIGACLVISYKAVQSKKASIQ